MQTILDKQENTIFIDDDLTICFAQCEQLNAMISTTQLPFSPSSSSASAFVLCAFNAIAIELAIESQDNWLEIEKEIWMKVNKMLENHI